MIARAIWVTTLALSSFTVCCGEIQVAMASNFLDAGREIAERFEAETGHVVNISSGSTGRHFAQISNGAPFDAFLAADADRPQGLKSSREYDDLLIFTYAIGRLVLWSPTPDLVDDQGKILQEGAFRFVAIANPKIAPYGQAAMEVLEHLGLKDRMKNRLVRGENISQTFQFVSSGNTELGFIALSQLTANPRPGSQWLVPRDLYRPIEQQAVLLTASPAARIFLEYLRSEESRKIIARYGYELPDLK